MSCLHTSAVVGCLCVFFWLGSMVLAADFTGPVVSVLDGDALEVLHHQHPERVRLSGIDCPALAIQKEKGRNVT